VLYAGCPLDRKGKICKKKLNERVENTEWYCETCGEVVMEPDWVYCMDIKISDHTDAHYATCFSETAEQIMGLPAKDLQILGISSFEFERQLGLARFQRMVFTVKAIIDEWQGDSRVKITVVRTSPIKYSEETKASLVWSV